MDCKPHPNLSHDFVFLVVQLQHFYLAIVISTNFICHCTVLEFIALE